jgi:hypothetical protein
MWVKNSTRLEVFPTLSENIKHHGVDVIFFPLRSNTMERPRSHTNAMRMPEEFSL